MEPKAVSVRAGCSVSSCSSGYLKLIYGNPAVTWETLEHGNKELEAAGPVADEEHHADQVKYPHEDAEGADELKWSFA